MKKLTGELRRLQVMIDEKLFKRLLEFCNKKSVKEGRLNVMSKTVREAIGEYLDKRRG
ncbi:hypothetical protein KKC91_09235 [bacterium]|nr:hypothetical protein [bacterium]